MPARRGLDDRPKRKYAPARTPQAREDQLITQAIDLAEQQIRRGTASAQVITHYLRLGSSRGGLEAERLRQENRVLEAKVKALESATNTEELYNNAIKAMRSYSGHDEVEIDEG